MLWLENIYRLTTERQVERALRICLAQSEALRTCQEIRPDVGQASMPRRVLSELPDYWCVLINHKMSSRVRIKLLVSLPTFSLSSPHTHCPALCIIKARGITSHLLTPLQRSSLRHCLSRSQECGQKKSKLYEVGFPKAFVSKA